MRLHFRSLAKIWKFFKVCFDKLDLFFLYLYGFIFFVWMLVWALLLLVQSKQKINLLYLLVLLLSLLLRLNILYFCFMVIFNFDFFLPVLTSHLVLLLMPIFLFSFTQSGLGLYLLLLLYYILFIWGLFLSYFIVLFCLQFLFERCQLLLLSRRMVEVAVVAFATVSLHVEGAVLSVFSQVHKGAILFPAGTAFKVSTNFSSLH